MRRVCHLTSLGSRGALEIGGASLGARVLQASPYPPMLTQVTERRLWIAELTIERVELC